MKKLILAAGTFGLLVLPLVSQAAYIKGGHDVFVSQSDSIGENAYLMGNTVTASAPSTGVVSVFGGTLNITSKRSFDLVVGGGTLNIPGASAEDARVAGGSRTVGGTCSGELMAAGGQINIPAGTTIAKDAHVAGG